MGGVLPIGWKIQIIGMQHTPIEPIIRLDRSLDILVLLRGLVHSRLIARAQVLRHQVTEHAAIPHALGVTDRVTNINHVQGLSLEHQRCLVRMEWVAPYIVGSYVEPNAAVVTQALRRMCVVVVVALLMRAQQARVD